jgi:transcriptional regulator with GAF, ATPase, and Fis domain
MGAHLYFLARVSTDIRTKLIQELDAAGIEVEDDNDNAVNFALVVFDEIDDALCSKLREIVSEFERVLAIGLNNKASTTDLWQLVQAGAEEVILWETSALSAATVAARLERWAEVDALVDSQPVRELLVGADSAWRHCLRRVVELARFTDTAVLILGESGTGKELVARLLHELDSRQNKANFVLLDCTTIVPELSGSEFFGHERGAFTNAIQAREGAVELADRGTLFIDEIGELAPALQSQLLRAVQEHTYKRVGGNVWRNADFRLFCATNRELADEVVAGRFRHDLYYRVAASIVRLPPLRERRGDIPLLARHFMQSLRAEETTLDFDDAVRDYLMSRDYPGNIRELRQIATRILYRHVGPGPITLGDIPEEDRPATQLSVHWRDAGFQQSIRKALRAGAGLKEIGRAAEDEAIDIAVDDAEGNLRRAAGRLGVTDRALQLRRANQRSAVLSSDETHI